MKKFSKKVILAMFFVALCLCMTLPVAAEEMIFPDSSTRYLNMGDFGGHTADELRIGRNEIYARYGRKFNSEDLQTYFSSCSWYEGTIDPDDFDEGLLSELERKNAENMEKFENRLRNGECPVAQSYDFSEMEDASSKELIDSYGYAELPDSLHDGYSNLLFSYNGGELFDEGTFYGIEMDLSLPALVSPEIKPGESEDVLVDAVTGQTKEFICTSWDPETGYWEFYSPEDTETYYGLLARDGESIELLWGSDDFVECLVEKDVYLSVRKDAIIVTAFMNRVAQVTEPTLQSWFNEVFFDEKGYVTCLASIGD